MTDYDRTDRTAMSRTAVAAEKAAILLVDDQPERLLTYETILASLGQDLVRALSGREALQLLLARDFAVVLLDVSMPDMDGFEIAKLIHEHPRFERTPIIFVTGVHVSELDRLRGYELGAVDYVSVPVVPQILRSKVSVLVELHSKRRELQDLNSNLARANGELQRVNMELETANRALQKEVDERARVELELKERDRHKDEFLAMLAHELRNPLAPIHNAVQVMHWQNVADPTLVRLRDIIARQVSYIVRLVDDLLDVSRITRGQINLTLESVEVATLLGRAVEIVQPMIEERGHRLSVAMPEGRFWVLGDRTRLTQALANLLSNAAKYTPFGGQISICGRVAGPQIELRFRDNGVGIRAGELPHIFDLFTQVEGSGGRAQRGLGIGLALVRRMVEMHTGSITAHSEGPGKGSEFVLRLPLQEEGAQRGEPQGPAGADAPRASAVPRRVLVADDNTDVVRSVTLLLAEQGHIVYTARDGQQALERAERFLPDVILLDIAMPVQDGYEVARTIRAQRWGRAMKLIAITGWGQISDRDRSHVAGFDAHLVKPVDLASLTEALGELPDREEPTA